MPAPLSGSDADARRARILDSARWCFLNFGFAKTSLEDIAKRAGLSRTLLYRAYKDKEEIFGAVFVDWLLSRRRAAEEVSTGPGDPTDRLLALCRLMVLEPWAEMICTPMGAEFLAACERIAPENEALYRDIMFGCVNAILTDEPSSEVFLLALDGLSADRPTIDVLDHRARLLIARFARHRPRKEPS